ncbi:FAD-binding protein [bacterium]|nr:FAD-binding protein [bacterium]
MSSDFEANGRVVIIGGGPAGLAAGIALAQLGRRPIVISRIDQASRSRPKIGESLAPRAWPILQRLGIEHLIDDRRHLQSPGTLSSWGHAGLASEDFLFHANGLGWHLDRNRFETELREFAESIGIQAIESTKFRIERAESNGWNIGLESTGKTIFADILIDASGRSAAVAQYEGVRRKVYDRLAAWYAFLESPTPIEDARAMVEARPEGWWYSALLPGGRLVVALFCDPARLAGMNRSMEKWQDSLAETQWTRQRVADGRYQATEPPRVAAADSSILERIGGSNWVACGDAAACYDPLSSHGIATALASGMDAASAVHAALGGDLEPFERYVDRVSRSFSYYFSMRAEVYAQEKRWSDSPFWAARSRIDFEESTC